jgi:hypothetical protein
MYEDWPETTKVLSAQLRNLRGGAPDVMKAFSGIAQTALQTRDSAALGVCDVQSVEALYCNSF